MFLYIQKSLKSKSREIGRELKERQDEFSIKQKLLWKMLNKTKISFKIKANY